MTTLQILLIIASGVFLYFSRDLWKRKKIGIIAFVIIFFGALLVLFFSFNIELLNKLGLLFGIQRGAELLVYLIIIVLVFLNLSLLNTTTKDKQQLTRLISQSGIDQTYANFGEKINNRKNTREKDDFIFNVRVYNEEKEVGKTIDEIIKEGFQKILLINDGSKDSSLKILREKQKEYPEALLLIASHTINRGGGAANQTGYNFIKKYADELKVKRFVGFDPDGQMDVKDMETFIQTIKRNELNNKKIDLYLGSRFVKDGKTQNMPKSRKRILAVSQWITKILYGIKVSDPHNGFRVISIDALQKFNLTADGMHYANEINEQIKEKKMTFEEIPVHIKYTDYSLGKGQKNSNSIKIGLEMIYKKFFFR